jgi:hypothetical protein
MKKYRVSVQRNMDQLLEQIRNRHLLSQWPSREFDDKESAEMYAFEAGLATGITCVVKEIDPDQYSTLRDRVKHILGAE